MGSRLDLHNELLKIAPKAYYNPPASAKMQYPCFRYKLTPPKILRADNRLYKQFPCYTVTYISLNVADDKVNEILTRFKSCKLDTHFINDGLNHYVFTIFY